MIYLIFSIDLYLQHGDSHGSLLAKIITNSWHSLPKPSSSSEIANLENWGGLVKPITLSTSLGMLQHLHHLLQQIPLQLH
jgi:hypothetical protein